MLLKEPQYGPIRVKSAEQILFGPFVPPAIEAIEHHFRVITAAGPCLPLYAILGHQLNLRLRVAVIGVDPQSDRALHRDRAAIAPALRCPPAFVRNTCVGAAMDR